MLKKKRKPRASKAVWLVILLFLVLILTFPKWITIFYPQPHQDLVLARAGESGVDPLLVFSIIRAESKYENTAESPVGAKGLMQIMPETARWIARQQGIKDFDPATLHDPETNISFGCWYLSYLNKEFKGHTPLVVAAYNAGLNKVREWIQNGVWDGDPAHLERIPYPETRYYVQTVLKNHQAYQSIYSSTTKYEQLSPGK